MTAITHTHSCAPRWKAAPELVALEPSATRLQGAYSAGQARPAARPALQPGRCRQPDWHEALAAGIQDANVERVQLATSTRATRGRQPIITSVDAARGDSKWLEVP